MTSHGKIHRLDFHLHSYASNLTDYYAANTFAIPESYSEPLELYATLKERGMALVTLTDHNSIDGVKELLDAGKQDVFISAEMTTTFPDDGCNIHLTVANVTEAQFLEVDRLRGNVFEMVDYLDRQIAAEAGAAAGNRIAYFMTHPLMSTQNREYGREGSLTADHIEQCLLLLDTFEVRNGTRTRAVNELTVRLLESLTREKIEQLADKHGIAPKGPTPWLKGRVSGSDDHCGINPGLTWTEFVVDHGGDPTPNDVVDSIRRRETRAGGNHGGPVTLAHAVIKLLHDGKTKNQDPNTKTVEIGGPLGSLLHLAFGPGRPSLRRKLAIGGKALLQQVGSRVFKKKRRQRSAPFERTLSREAHAMLLDPTFQRRLATCERTDDKIFLIVSSLINRIFVHYVNQIGSTASLDLVAAVKEIVALVSSNIFVSLPYLLSYFHTNADRLILRDVHKQFDITERPRTVLVTDTLFEVNGVARTIRRMIDEARRRDLDFTVVTCLDGTEREEQMKDPAIRELVDSGRLKIFDALVSRGFPQYEGLSVRFPPFLELLKYLQESGFTKMQISTPGTIGVAGLLAAKVLQIETSSTYHTCFPEYVENYTRDISLEAIAWKYMVLFYHSVDEVVVPSKFIAKLLHDRGLRKRKLLVLDRWVDVDRFHPKKRVADYWTRYGVEQPERKIKFTYVGRLGVEKNLSVLADAFRGLAEERDDVHLCLIGDGPFRAELEQRLSGLPVTFTGFLGGEELGVAIASCDAKIFPSTTDTWGNAPLEAQAAGLPVVVSDMGGPQELMIDGTTGFKVKGRDVQGLIEAMRRLTDRPTRTRMGLAARAFTERNRIDEPFTAILDSATFRRRAKAAKQDVRETKTEIRREYGDARDDAVVEPPEVLVFSNDTESTHAGILDR